VGPDRWLAERLHDLVDGHPLVVDLLRIVTGFGKPPVLAGASVVLALVLLAARRVRAAAFVAVATVGAWVLDLQVLALNGRDRPHVPPPPATPSGPSFPSGHAMVATAAYGALLVLVLPRVPPARRALAIAVAVSLVAAIGLTRIVLGVHWATDVLGGFALGAAWVALCAAVLRPSV
jgi:undecaprenyl-diphosphatase